VGGWGPAWENLVENAATASRPSCLFKAAVAKLSAPSTSMGDPCAMDPGDVVEGGLGVDGGPGMGIGRPVTLFVNGTFVDGRTLFVDPFWSMHDLVLACSRRMGFAVTKVFQSDGGSRPECCALCVWWLLGSPSPLHALTLPPSFGATSCSRSALIGSQHWCVCLGWASLPPGVATAGGEVTDVSIVNEDDVLFCSTGEAFHPVKHKRKGGGAVTVLGCRLPRAHDFAPWWPSGLWAGSLGVCCGGPSSVVVGGYTVGRKLGQGGFGTVGAAPADNRPLHAVVPCHWQPLE
jgi:hypothetical protein